jgi:hypothetical protein
MKQIIPPGRDASEPRLRVLLGIGKAARVLSITLLCVAALSAPDLAYAAHGGGGGGGGGVHGGGGGFHGGGAGFHESGGAIGFHGGGGAGGSHGAGLADGFHGGNLGGFHGAGPGSVHAGGFRGFHSGGFSGGGFRAGTSVGAGMGRFAGSSREGAGNSVVLRGGEHTGHWQRGWRNGRYGWQWSYDPYLWSSDGSYDDSYSDEQPDVAQSEYYCADPAGYYPDITQCNTAWQSVPGG